MTARHLLENWSNCRENFVKVFPMEYKRALKELYSEKNERTDVAAA